MEKPAQVAAEVFLDLLDYADAARAEAPTDERIMDILNRLTEEDAITFKMNRAGDVLLGAEHLVIGVMEALTWLVEELAESTGSPRTAVIGDLRGHIALA